MSEFNNEVYEALVLDLINDAFYLESRSRRGTISTIRQYTEVIIRKILGLSNQEFVTLGNRNLLNQLIERSENNPILIESLEAIRTAGNKCTHTQEVLDITQEEVNNCVDSLFKLYSYLFIAFFEKYKFGNNDKITSSFSILPPIIRFISLDYLYEKDPNNIMIIDKLSLAILKAFDKHTALDWLNERRSSLDNRIAITEEALEKYAEMGEDVVKTMTDIAPDMYSLCVDRIIRVDSTIQQNGALYNDFESAKELYENKGHIEEDTEEAKEFNSIMQFVYLGRKSVKNEKLQDLDKYITSSLI